MRPTTVRLVDTNVLLYAISDDPSEAAKASIANELLSARDLVVSAQVLQEFYVQATRPSRPGRLSHEQAAALVSAFCRFPVQAVTTEVVLAAVLTSHRHQISYWDAAIVEAARVKGCATVLSEDLNHGQDFDGIRVLNPVLDPAR